MWSRGIQLQEGKWVGIIAIKTERMQIHFLSDVLIAVASLDLKVPIVSLYALPIKPASIREVFELALDSRKWCLQN